VLSTSGRIRVVSSFDIFLLYILARPRTLGCSGTEASLAARHWFRFFDCDWSLLNHGVAYIKRLNLGNLNPIYERELTKLELHQGEGKWNVSKYGARGRGCRHK
jgi:hypothetical protein